jgi:Abortive infection C-terminus
MSENDVPLAKLLELKEILLDHVQQGNGDQNRYAELRGELLADNRLFRLLPDFLKQDTTLLEVRRRSQQLGGYAPRREFIAGALQPTLDYLQQPVMTPVEEVIAGTLSTIDSAHVRLAWQKAIDRLKGDPDGAITIARTLVEAVCKKILGPGAYDNDWDLPRLYRGTARRLRLDPDRCADESLKLMLRGCGMAVEGLAAVRNKFGDAHGKGDDDPVPKGVHAELAVIVAGTMASLLVAAWEESGQRADGGGAGGDGPEGR